MVITQTVLRILRVLRRYKFLNRRIVQDLFFPNDKDGSVTRDVLRKMKEAGLVRTVRAEGGVPDSTSTAPVHVPTEAGCCVLAHYTGDMADLLDCQPNMRAWQNYTHYLFVTRLFLTIDAALARQDYVRMPRLFFEHDILNPGETDSRKKFKLYSVVKEDGNHKVVCVPDAAAEVRVGKFCRADYFELERGTDTPNRAAAKKSGGYFGLCQSQKFLAHFPDAQLMRVNVICPHAAWRDAMRRATKDKPGAELWRFASVDDVKPDTFLHAPIFYTCADEKPVPFVKAPLSAAAVTTVGGQAGEWKGEHA